MTVSQGVNSNSTVYYSEEHEMIFWFKNIQIFIFFIDRSKDCPGIGAAFFDFDLNVSAKFKINANISIMEAEQPKFTKLYLRYIESNNYDRFDVLSDSKSSFQNLLRCTSAFQRLPVYDAYAILKLLLKLQVDPKIVYLQWIPSHVGISGNKKADLLAKEAISDGIDLESLVSKYIFKITFLH